MRVSLKDIVLVSIQFVLFIVYAIPIEDALGFSPFFKTTGLGIAFIGFLIALLAVFQLNKNLSPFPTPTNNAVLIQNGLFRLVRHPIYSGLILLFFGYGIYVDSLFKLMISLLLLLLFYFKTNYEEQQLQRKFSNYSVYKQKVGRFFPKIKITSSD